MVSVGIDIVHLPKIEKLLRSEAATRKIFHESEISDNRPEHLAGIFAAKEAFFKAIGKKADWLSVEIARKNTGEPKIKTSLKKKISLSISHDGEYAIAIVIVDGK